MPMTYFLTFKNCAVNTVFTDNKPTWSKISIFFAFSQK